METTPITNGRTKKGTFTKGNKGGPGNPHVAKVAALKTAFYAAVTPADMQAIVRKLVKEAKNGNVLAAREVLDRTLPKLVDLEVSSGEGFDGIAFSFMLPAVTES